MLKISFLQMVLKKGEMGFNCIKIAFFSKQLLKIAQAGGFPIQPHSLRRLGAPPPDPHM